MSGANTTFKFYSKQTSGMKFGNKEAWYFTGGPHSLINHVRNYYFVRRVLNF